MALEGKHLAPVSEQEQEKVTLRIDPNSLDLGELADFEEATGKEFHEFLGEPLRDDDGKLVRDDEGKPVASFKANARALIALAWIARRRSDPEFTLEDARRIKVVDATRVAAPNPIDNGGSVS